jgi:hypothetical protein
MTNQPQLDPRTANFTFRWDAFGDYPDGDYNIGRVYCWYDPNRILPAVDDHKLRSRYAHINDRMWRRLVDAACRRDDDRLPWD